MRKPTKKRKLAARRSLARYDYQHLIDLAGGTPAVVEKLGADGYTIKAASVRAWKARNSIPAPYVFDVLRLAAQKSRKSVDAVIGMVEVP